ncbi:hypothetical protein Bbelb_335030 [Branchiostoma belcheri]|nr:hypothetical protein Bbelb_335030 [Branchiostoma belcheri]
MACSAQPIRATYQPDTANHRPRISQTQPITGHVSARHSQSQATSNLYQSLQAFRPGGGGATFSLTLSVPNIQNCYTSRGEGGDLQPDLVCTKQTELLHQQGEGGDLETHKHAEAMVAAMEQN